MKRSAHVLLGITAALGLAGCKHTAVGQTVAVVNGEEITASQLNSEIGRMNVPAGAPKDAVRAQALQNIVNRRLLVQQAKEKGIDKSPDYLDQQRAADDTLLIQMSAIRQASTMPLPTPQTVTAFKAANPFAFADRQVLGVDQLRFDASTNPAIIAQVKSAHTMAALAAVLAAAKVPAEHSKQQIDTATVPTPIMKQIVALPADEPFIVPGAAPGQLIANVIVSRQSAPLPPEAAQRAASDALRKQTLDLVIGKSLDQLRKSAKIEYQPGYAPKKPVATGAPAK